MEARARARARTLPRRALPRRETPERCSRSSDAGFSSKRGTSLGGKTGAAPTRSKTSVASLSSRRKSSHRVAKCTILPTKARRHCEGTEREVWWSRWGWLCLLLSTGQETFPDLRQCLGAQYRLSNVDGSFLRGSVFRGMKRWTGALCCEGELVDQGLDATNVGRLEVQRGHGPTDLNSREWGFVQGVGREGTPYMDMQREKGGEERGGGGGRGESEMMGFRLNGKSQPLARTSGAHTGRRRGVGRGGGERLEGRGGAGGGGRGGSGEGRGGEGGERWASLLPRFPSLPSP